MTSIYDFVITRDNFVTQKWCLGLFHRIAHGTGHSNGLQHLQVILRIADGTALRHAETQRFLEHMEPSCLVGARRHDVYPGFTSWGILGHLGAVQFIKNGFSWTLG